MFRIWFPGKVKKYYVTTTTLCVAQFQQLSTHQRLAELMEEMIVFPYLFSQLTLFFLASLDLFQPLCLPIDQHLPLIFLYLYLPQDMPLVCFGAVISTSTACFLVVGRLSWILALKGYPKAMLYFHIFLLLSPQLICLPPSLPFKPSQALVNHVVAMVTHPHENMVAPWFLFAQFQFKVQAHLW